MKTTKDIKVIYLQKAYYPKTGAYQGWTGKLRVVAGDPFHDDYANWDEQGQEIDHEYGDINLRDGRK